MQHQVAVEQGLTSHQTHCRSYQERDVAPRMTSDVIG